MPAEIIQQLIDEQTPDVIECDQVEFDAISVFSKCQTQWKRNDMSGLRTGLDYNGVVRVAELLGINLTADVFGALQVMEIEVITESNKRRG